MVIAVSMIAMSRKGNNVHNKAIATIKMIYSSFPQIYILITKLCVYRHTIAEWRGRSNPFLLMRRSSDLRSQPRISFIRFEDMAKSPHQMQTSCLSIGRGRRDRTLGTRFWRPLLYHLSYTPISGGPSGTRTQDRPVMSR